MRRSGLRQAGPATELRVYAVRSGALLSGQVSSFLPEKIQTQRKTKEESWLLGAN